jgi:predicted GNAT superfamily acetyltransferase
MSEPVVIRSCHTLAEFQACVALQRQVWEEEPLEVEPATMFVVAAHTGGQVIGAFAGEALVGFVLAVAGVRDGQPYLHSHMAAVDGAYRGHGIGRKLKLFQREEALQHGINLIEWTFDPLEVRNGHFNLNRLGAVCRKFLVNLYGVTTSPLHRGLRTDRLLAEWHLNDPRVIAAASEESVDAVSVGETTTVEISVPKKVPYDLAGDVSEGVALQDRLRDEFTKWFAHGYVATGVVTGEKAAYILTKPVSQRTVQASKS